MGRSRRSKAIYLRHDAVRRETTQPCDNLAICLSFKTGLNRFPIIGRATFRMWRASRTRARHDGRRFSMIRRFSPFRHLAHLT